MRYDQFIAWPVLKLHVQVTKCTRPLNQGGMVTTFGVSPVALLWQPLTDYLCRGDHNKSLHWDDKFAQREENALSKDRNRKDQRIRKGINQEKNVFFWALPASLNPHPPWLQLGQLGPLFSNSWLFMFPYLSKGRLTKKGLQKICMWGGEGDL